LPEIRKDPITGRWVIIATDPVRRPSQFLRVPVVASYGDCQFCAGSEDQTPPEVLSYRDGSNQWTLRVVPNKFPALRVEGVLERQGEGLYDKMSGIGAHEVIIESPEHKLSLAELTDRHVENLFWAFRDRILDLKRDTRLRYVLLFKNHGERAGASLEHSHSQIIALPVVPVQVQEELDGSLRYFEFKQRCVYCDIVRQECASGGRVILDTDEIVVLSPYAARFPFETWIVPRRHSSHFETSQASVIQSLAWAVRATLRKIERVLESPSYNLLIHTAPVQEGPLEHYHWHLEIIPRLTKVAGFEWGAGFYINPTPPEEAAQFLRDAGL
jgi:UDPglucose--hexose-1-phosphate uridylyltransferase